MKKNLLFVFLAMVLVASSAFSEMTYRYSDTVSNIRGDVIGGATVTVYNANTTTKAVIYEQSDTALGELPNPTGTDTYGRFFFYSSPGLYDVVVSGVGIVTYTIEDIRIWSDGSNYIYSVVDCGAIAGDGIDDTEAIQACVIAAEADGGAVYFPSSDGAYNTEKIDIETGGIKIFGHNTDIIHSYETVMAGAGGDSTSKAWPVFMVYRDADNVEITGFNFSSDASVVAALATLSNEYHSMVSPIIVNMADNAWIHHNRFNNEGPRGVFQYGGNYMNLEDNTFNGVGIGVHVGHTLNTNFWDEGVNDADPWFSPVGTTIHNNLIDGYDHFEVNCLFASGLQDFSITDNIIRDMDVPTRTGLYVYCNDLGTTDINGVPVDQIYGEVSGNIVTGTFLNAIAQIGIGSHSAVVHQFNVTYDNNTARGTGVGLYMDRAINTRFSDNHFVVAGTALEMTRELDDVVFSGNYFESTAAGSHDPKVTAWVGSNLSSHNAIFSHNAFVTPPEQKMAFYLPVGILSDVSFVENVFDFRGNVATPCVFNCSNARGTANIIGNKFDVDSANIADNPLFIFSSTASLVYNDNILVDSTSDMSPDEIECIDLVYKGNDVVGLDVDASGKAIVKENVLTHLSADAVPCAKFHTDSDDVVFSGNDLYNDYNGQPGVSFVSVDNAIIRDNTVECDYAGRPIRIEGTTVAVGSGNITVNNGGGGTGYYIVDTATIVADIIGSGDPNGSVHASPGSVYKRTDGIAGATGYLKQSGTSSNTDWVAVSTTAAADPKYHQTWMLPITSAPSPAYIGGFYDFSGSSNDFVPSVTFGITDVPVSAHFMIVTGEASVDEVTITITGDRITDSSPVDVGYVDTIVIPNGTPKDTYFETSSKWLGEITIETTAGADVLCDYGWCKYWDNGNTDFTVVGGEAIWMGDNTSTIDIILYHHKDTGWTYTGSGPTPPAPLFAMSDFHGTNVLTDSNDYGCFKRSGGSFPISGSASEGVIVGFTFTTSACIEYGQITLEYTQ